VYNPNTTSPALSGTGNGTTKPEQYRAYDPTTLNDPTPILPGETAILRSEETGLYCQLRPTPENATQIAMYCDQASPSTATPVTYTGSGLSYNGVPLVSTGPDTPLLLANTTTVPPTASSGQLTFSPAGKGNQTWVVSGSAAHAWESSCLWSCNA
jgi:hypothetical protein